MKLKRSVLIGIYFIWAFYKADQTCQFVSKKDVNGQGGDDVSMGARRDLALDICCRKQCRISCVSCPSTQHDLWIGFFSWYFMPCKIHWRLTWMKTSCVLKSGPQMELLESRANTTSAGFPPQPLLGLVLSSVAVVTGEAVVVTSTAANKSARCLFFLIPVI